MSKRDTTNKQHYVVIGGGPAGLSCAETLRQAGFTGEITMISNDSIVPYDRTALSKAVATGDASQFKLRSDEFLKEAAIDV